MPKTAQNVPLYFFEKRTHFISLKNIIDIFNKKNFNKNLKEGKRR